MNQTTATKVKVLAIHNAERRMEEIDKLDFVVNAKADYYNGLVQGFKDGAKWALLERLTEQDMLYLLDNDIIIDYIQTHRAAKRTLELQDTWASMVASEQMNIQKVLTETNSRVKAENKLLKRQIEWMQETMDKLHMENFERDFGKRGVGIKDLKKEIKAFLMANGRYAGSSETAQILREIADEWDD